MMSCVMMMQIWQFTGNCQPKKRRQQQHKTFLIRFTIIVRLRLLAALPSCLTEAHSQASAEHKKQTIIALLSYTEFMCGPLFYALLNTNNHNIEL
jgi:hypothetical protein